MNPDQNSEFSERWLCDFTGRQWLVQRVQEFLDDPQAPRFLLIVGEPGIGKSTFAAHLWQREQMLGAVHFCIGRRSGTTEPLSFIQSIAEQLSDRLPGFGQALLEAQKEFADRTVVVTVTQRIESMQGGQVTGVSIQDLGNRILASETLFHRLIRCPLRALEQTRSLPRAVILVDALDEATTHSSRPDIVEILTRAQDLPTQVRFILTSRPDPSITNSFADTQHITIEAQSPENQEDVARYLTRILRRDRQLQGLVLDAGWDEARFVKTLGEMGEWNFLYLSLVLPEIAAGHLPLGEAALPCGLDGYYQYLLSTRLGSEKWDGWGADLMEIVLTLQEPASLEQIAAYLEWPKRQTLRCLDQVGQLLDPTLRDQGRYWRYHWSVANFLFDRARAEEFWCEDQEGHVRVADYYLCAWGGFEAGLPGLQELEKRDLHCGYGLRHLAAHLEGAKRHDVLHDLLALNTGEQRNAWFEAKYAAGDTAGYVADVMRAWTLAEMCYSRVEDMSATRSIGLQCRYALIGASLNSLALSVPPVLISTLVESGMWSWEQGLAHARQIPWPERRARTLASLVPHLPEEVRKDVIGEGLAATREIGSSPESFYRDRLTKSRIELLAGLAPYLPASEREPVLCEGLATAQSISEQALRSEVISGLAPCLSKSLLQQALKLVYGFGFDFGKAETLAGLAPYLKEPLLSQALTVARAIEHPASQAVALLGLAPYVPEKEVLEEALAAIQKSPRRDWDSVPWAEGLIKLASRSPKPMQKQLLSKALAEIRGIRIRCSNRRALMLMRLAPHLSEPLRGQILQEALVAARASPEKAPYGYGYRNYRVEALTQLAILFAKLDYQKEALAVVREIEKKWRWYDEYVEALSGVARRLPEPMMKKVLHKALTERQMIRDGRTRVDVLRELAPYLPKTFGLWVLWARSKVSLTKLTAIPRLRRRQWWSQIRGWLLSNIPEPLLGWRLAIAQVGGNEWRWAYTVGKLAPYMSEPLLREVLTVAQEAEEIDDGEQYLENVTKIEDPNLRATEMAVAQARISTGEFGGLPSRSAALAGLAPRLAELQRTQEAIEVAHEIDSDSLRARTLVDIAPYLEEPLRGNVLEEALEVTRAVVPKWISWKLLADLAPKLVELGCLNGALAAVQEMESAELRAETLAAMATQLTKLHHQLYSLWQEMFPVLASRTRGDLLFDLRALAPVITELGGKEAVIEACHAIQDVGRWWP